MATTTKTETLELSLNQLAEEIYESLIGEKFSGYHGIIVFKAALQRALEGRKISCTVDELREALDILAENGKIFLRFDVRKAFEREVEAIGREWEAQFCFGIQASS